jgi:hypothetical protein
LNKQLLEREADGVLNGVGAGSGVGLPADQGEARDEHQVWSPALASLGQNTHFPRPFRTKLVEEIGDYFDRVRCDYGRAASLIWALFATGWGG